MLLPGFLASCAERQYGDLYRFVLHTGMTFTETVKLCWEEVDLDRGSIAVVGRTRIQRRIPLDEEAKQILMERKNPLHGTMILFLPAGPVARLRSSMWQRNYRNSPKNWFHRRTRIRSPAAFYGIHSCTGNVSWKASVCQWLRMLWEPMLRLVWKT